MVRAVITFHSSDDHFCFGRVRYANWLDLHYFPDSPVPYTPGIADLLSYFLGTYIPSTVYFIQDRFAQANAKTQHIKKADFQILKVGFWRIKGERGEHKNIRKNLEFLLTKKEEYATMVLHTVIVCPFAHSLQHGHITTGCPDCQEANNKKLQTHPGVLNCA